MPFSGEEHIWVFVPSQSSLSLPRFHPGSDLGQHPCWGEYRSLLPFSSAGLFIYCIVPSDPKLLADGNLWFEFL